MKKLILTAIVLTGIQAGFAQSPITKNVGDFTALKVYDKIPVRLVASSSAATVEITGSKSSDVQVINKNGELRIRMSTLKSFNGDDVKVVVHYVKLNAVTASEGSTVVGSGALNAGILSLDARSGGSIKLPVHAQQLDAKVGSGGSINASGAADNETVSVTAGGSFSGKELKAKLATVSISAGGDATVFATDGVVARTRAGGTINIYGSPKSVDKSTTAGGTINVY